MVALECNVAAIERGRERHLLALKTAVPVLMGGSLLIGVASIAEFKSPAEMVEAFFFLPLGVLGFFGLVYAARYVWPGKAAFELDQAVQKPPFALRAAVGAMLGVASASTILVASTALDPFAYRRPPREYVALELGLGIASVLIGILVYAFSSVLYLRVQRSTSTNNVSVLWLILIFNWGRDVYEETAKKGFWVALVDASWISATMVLGLIVGWRVYAHFVPCTKRTLPFLLE